MRERHRRTECLQYIFGIYVALNLVFEEVCLGSGAQLEALKVTRNVETSIWQIGQAVFEKQRTIPK